MFDPDNFYEVLRCEYGWPRTQNILMHFYPHGSKNLMSLTPLLAIEEKNIWYNKFNPGDQSIFGKIILHDQEPFFIDDAVYTYRQHLLANTNRPEFSDTVKALDSAELINCHLRSGLQPIICHSELNSPDIDRAVNDCLMIECYYWYHAMIARDWFRHWQYHPDLVPKDRGDTFYRFMMYARGLDGSREYRKKFIEYMRPHQHQTMYHWDRESSASAEYSAKISVTDANQSRVHIVLETLFETPKIHLTEKVFKPMVMSQPFFLLAGPGALGYLRRYGFQTFGESWDESYDDIPDPHERMSRIKLEIDRLAAMSEKEFNDLYKSTLPAIIHNRRHFFSQEFQDICIKEMKQNFKNALESQSQNRMKYLGGSWLPTVSAMLERGLYVPPIWEENVTQMLQSHHQVVPRATIFDRYPALMRYSS